MGCTKT